MNTPCMIAAVAATRVSHCCRRRSASAGAARGREHVQCRLLVYRDVNQAFNTAAKLVCSTARLYFKLSCSAARELPVTMRRVVRRRAGHAAAAKFEWQPGISGLSASHPR